MVRPSRSGLSSQTRDTPYLPEHWAHIKCPDTGFTITLCIPVHRKGVAEIQRVRAQHITGA